MNRPALLPLLAGLLHLSPLLAAPAEIGVISAAEKPVQLLRATSVYQANAGTRLQSADYLEAGSTGVLIDQLAGTRIALGPHTRLYLEHTGNTTHLNLLQGWLKLQPLTGVPQGSAPRREARQRQVRPQLESLLSQQIGPLARLLVKRSLASADDFASLRSALLPHIPSERGREQFVAATEALLATTETPPQDDSLPHQTDTTDTPAPKLDPAFLQASETRLTYLIGPIARIVMRRALPHASTRQALLQALAEHIPDPAQRSAFLEEQP